MTYTPLGSAIGGGIVAPTGPAAMGALLVGILVLVDLMLLGTGRRSES